MALRTPPSDAPSASTSSSATAPKAADGAARAAVPPTSAVDTSGPALAHAMPAHVPETPHRPALQPPGAPSVPAEGAKQPHRAVALPAGTDWKESRFSGQTSVEILYTPNAGDKPLRLVVHLSKRHYLTEAALDGPQGEANARAFEDTIADLLESVAARQKLPEQWQRLQLTLTPSGELEKVTVFRAGKVEQVEVDDKDGGLRSVAKRFFNFWHGNDTATIENLGVALPPSDAAEKRRLEKRRAHL